MTRPTQRSLEPDLEVFAREGEVGIGAVRRVLADHIEVHIENHGTVLLAPEHVQRVHDGKLVLALDRLPADVRAAVERAHDREDPLYEAPDDSE